MPAFAPALEYWVASDDRALEPLVLRTATVLRRSGYAVEYALREQALGKQLKAAVSAGAHAAVILRREQLAGQGTVTVRRLADGAEETLPMDVWLEQATGPVEGRPPAASNGA
jgi:histidyl-tRNA synthetase